MSLPPRSIELVEATPLHTLEGGTKACVEFTVYKDGHAAIAVSRIEGVTRSRTIVQADSLPLNHVVELKAHIDAVVEYVKDAAER